MKRRTRHTLTLLGVPILLLLALGGWIVDAIRKPHAAPRGRTPTPSPIDARRDATGKVLEPDSQVLRALGFAGLGFLRSEEIDLLPRREGISGNG